ncbi:unnamed protein product [Paramecium pentaurelia]|uniref:RING-type domain-containing protein n=1 Tax=Paramecium pentaurelia TaxID=43138 RepID=A0A8S1WQM9_9CILI|nr:unnamed protein product [Paramecium pentaurelia]
MLLNRRYTKIFYKGLQHTRYVMLMCRAYSIFKFMMTTIFTLTINCERCELTNWMLAQIVMQIAERLNHMIQIEGEQNYTIELQNFQYQICEDLDPYLYLSQEEIDRKSKILAVQIRYELVSKYKSLRMMSIIIFWITQILVVWAIRLQMFNPEHPESYYTCYRHVNTFQLAFLLLTIYQYLDVYILSLLIIIGLPFLIPLKLWYKFKETKKNYENQQSIKELKKTCLILYHFQNIQGDQECGICMHDYIIDEKLLILPCDPKHHFHLQCIQAWLLINSTCPKCRASFLRFNQQQQQQ